MGTVIGFRILCKYLEGSRYIFLLIVGFNLVCKGKNLFYGVRFFRGFSESGINLILWIVVYFRCMKSMRRFLNLFFIKCDCILESGLVDILSK